MAMRFHDCKKLLMPEVKVTTKLHWELPKLGHMLPIYQSAKPTGHGQGGSMCIFEVASDIFTRNCHNPISASE